MVTAQDIKLDYCRKLQNEAALEAEIKRMHAELIKLRAMRDKQRISRLRMYADPHCVSRKTATTRSFTMGAVIGGTVSLMFFSLLFFLNMAGFF